MKEETNEKERQDLEKRPILYYQKTNRTRPEGTPKEGRGGGEGSRLTSWDEDVLNDLPMGGDGLALINPSFLLPL